MPIITYRNPKMPFSYELVRFHFRQQLIHFGQVIKPIFGVLPFMAKRLFCYQCNNNNGRYEVNKIDTVVNSLEDILECFNMTDLEVNMFAIFKDDIKPMHEYSENRFKLTIRIDENIDFIEFLEKNWNKNTFDIKEVNGIYITSKKISVWLRKRCDIEALDDYNPKFIIIKHKPDKSTLNRFWRVGLFNSDNFKYMDRQNHRDRFIETKSEEMLFRNIKRFYYLKEDGYGVFLSSNILNEGEWRKPHQNNRLIFGQATVNLKTANMIWSDFAMSIVLTIFPKFSNIYIGFSFYRSGRLQIGLYLSGKERFATDYEASEGAIIVGHKLKQTILKYCDADNVDEVLIKNAVPSNDADFLNPIYQYLTNIRV